MKKLLIFLGSALTLVAIFYMISSNKRNLTNEIIKYIDNNYNEDSLCILSMNDITNFEWDKMLIYQVGSSNVAISEALGIEFKGTVDLESGIIFVKGSKIVYKESIPYDPEKPSKLIFYAGSILSESNYKVFTPQNSFFKCSKKKEDGIIYYTINLPTEDI